MAQTIPLITFLLLSINISLALHVETTATITFDQNELDQYNKKNKCNLVVYNLKNLSETQANNMYSQYIKEIATLQGTEKTKTFSYLKKQTDNHVYGPTQCDGLLDKKIQDIADWFWFRAQEFICPNCNDKAPTFRILKLDDLNSGELVPNDFTGLEKKFKQHLINHILLAPTEIKFKSLTLKFEQGASYREVIGSPPDPFTLDIATYWNKRTISIIQDPRLSKDENSDLQLTLKQKQNIFLRSYEKQPVKYSEMAIPVDAMKLDSPLSFSFNFIKKPGEYWVGFDKINSFMKNLSIVQPILTFNSLNKELQLEITAQSRRILRAIL